MAILCTTAQGTLHEQGRRILRLIQEPNARSHISYDDTDPIPDPALFRFDVKASDPEAPLPTVAECAAHLELLHAINHVRRRVLNSTDLDQVLDLEPVKQSFERNTGWTTRYTVELRDKGFAQRREAKWPFYMRLAVARFFVWLHKMDMLVSRGQTLSVCPPLDVLIAWHSALLNPAWFRQYCEEHHIRHMRQVAFPWQLIHQAINADWALTLTPDQESHFRYLTGHEPDLLAYLLGPKHDEVAQLLPLIWHEPTPIRETLRQAHRVARLVIFQSDRAFVDSCQAALAMTAPALYLTAAIERQRVFVDKMVDFLWVRSPAAAATLRRAIDRYDHFLLLFRLCPGTVLVPTLDIDLVWHTHQCSAAVYEAGMDVRAGRFINHEDTIQPAVLRTQSDETDVLFRRYFGLQYHVCLCWECEAVRSAVEELGDEELGTTDFAALGERTADRLLHYRVKELSRR
ncbi:uncharacterized protein ACLA_078310 [Aspergillus clavatus NRRL 1]|uniref:Uncharacterized protein n=1 Tax=Aspergillus clavatus (strain ATCC 1007 / CBS 513.65 / DSM 816 / NCTC 3887 / NRRL 1 / QM 1276 / 107) TaxID=344612 RepID=A1CLV4_ASPCL|nr:uncharacterized protein ACLA_078310 [Aspergillus clavatus NRRL 1]EAW09083.1 conserved hypothetical protein [Aspergillus clavatus NRRL 1]